MRILSLIMLVIACHSVGAQSVLVWQKTYGGSGHEYIHKTLPLVGGGFAFVGYSESDNGDLPDNAGMEDLWVARGDAAGNIIWSYSYGGTEDEEGYDIVQMPNGNFFVVGWTDSQDGDVGGHFGTYGSDLWILKLSPAGQLLNQHCFGGTDDDEASSVGMTSDGKLIVAGTTYSYDGDVTGNHGTYEADFWAIKIDTGMNILNSRCIGGTDYEECYNMVVTSDQGCILTGRSSSSDGDATGFHGGPDLLIAKLNSLLAIEWAYCYGGTETEEGNSVVQLIDGTYAALGYTSTHNNGDVTGHHGSQGMDDFWLLKLSSAGTLVWAKCYGGSGDDQANGLVAASGGGYVMSGLTNSTDGDVSGFHTGFWDPDVWVAKTDATGNFQWQRCCGGTGQDESFHVYEEGAGVFVVTGFTYSSDFDVTINHGDADGWILKVTGSSGLYNSESVNSNLLWPNPANECISIADEYSSVRVYNLSGSLVMDLNLVGKDVISVNNLAAGVYIAELTGKNARVKIKFEIIR